jgi:hypothetical protein
MFCVSGFFVALNVVAYLIAIGKLEPIGTLPTIGYFDAITRIINIFSTQGFQSIIDLFKADWFHAIYFFSPILLFLFAAGNVINDFFRVLSGKYEKVANIVSKSFICAAVLFMCCFGLINAFKMGQNPNITQYFTELYATDALVFTAAMVGIGGLAFAILFAIVPFFGKRDR